MPAPPFLAPFPAQKLREKINQDDWEACLQAWSLFLAQRLLLNDKEFASHAASGDSSIPAFLTSYCEQTALSAPQPHPGSSSAQLHGLVFRLAIRTLQVPTPPSTLLTFAFLYSLSILYGNSSVLKTTLQDVWQRHSLETSTSLSKHKRSLIATTSADPTLSSTLLASTSLSIILPSYAHFLLAGSELPETLATLFSATSSTPSLRTKLTSFSYILLRSLLFSPTPNPTSLLDHLYDLKSSASQSPTSPFAQYLRALVSQTRLLDLLRRKLKGSSLTRAELLITYLQTLDDGSQARKRAVRRGKKKAAAAGDGEDGFGHGAVGSVHVHRMASVSEIQELFPDLGAGFVVRLLDYYGEDVERVTAGLLEETLPAELAGFDRSEVLREDALGDVEHSARILEPRSTPPLEEPTTSRRNIYDDDAFSNLAISTRNLHIGKKNTTSSSTFQPGSDKARIYSALAAFDSDDDERDDTYDVEDVGGTVDVQGYDKETEDASAEQHSEALYRAWKMSPGSFARDGVARKSAARAALRSETGMTDEAIEGFAVMLRREPGRLRGLEARFPDFGGEQSELRSTRWRDVGEGAESAGDEGMGSGGRGRGRGGERGGGRGGRGRGRGNVAGPADDKGTQIARQRKDENKAQRANHNRRAQRAKKMARGGFAG